MVFASKPAEGAVFLGRGRRYWGILAVKLLGFVVVAVAFWLTAGLTVFQVELFPKHWPYSFTSLLSLAVAVFLFPGVLAVLLHAIFKDQRYRCRTCGRRLRMPLDQGRRTHPMTEPPGTGYICAYGHGKLVTELWISGDPPDAWTEYGDVWEELFEKSDRR